MSHLYNNKKQEQLFHLHTPRMSTSEDCDPIKYAFRDFKCEQSYVLAQPTEEFNCIGWAVGIQEFIDPTREINKYYDAKVDAVILVPQDIDGTVLSIPSLTLYDYKINSTACMKAIKLFFEERNNRSVLPNKDYYIATDKISSSPSDDTIAFYFKAGQDTLEEEGIMRKGFQHAARYVEEVNSWVSDIWTSKLGNYKLMTHEEHELDGETYGEVLCYLVPNSNDPSHDDL